MSYCPRCRHEYSDTIDSCIECGTPLIRGRRPAMSTLDLEDFLIPVGAFFCGIVAMIMLWLRIAAQFGWIKGTFANLIEIGQPPCMTVFYAVAAFASVVVLAWWVIQVFVLKRG